MTTRRSAEARDGAQLRVQHLGVVGRGGGRLTDRASNDLDVEADLLLEGADLAQRSSTKSLVRVVRHRVMDAPDEAREADDALEVDSDDLVWRSVVTVAAFEFTAQLVGEGRLARVARAEQGDVRLSLERQRDLMRKWLHADDLRWVVDWTVPDEWVDGCHQARVPLAGTVMDPVGGTNRRSTSDRGRRPGCDAPA